jgi:hypothetical protein
MKRKSYPLKGKLRNGEREYTAHLKRGDNSVITVIVRAFETAQALREIKDEVGDDNITLTSLTIMDEYGNKF